MLSSTFNEMTTSTSFKDLLHAENLRHVNDEFISSPKEEGRADYFFASKVPTASTGYEHANFGPEGQHAYPKPPKPQNKRYAV
jgi:hypothetical protein